MSTVNDIIVAAFGRSRQNEPGDLANFSSELLAVVNRALLSYYAMAAKINPEYVGEVIVVSEASGVWARPATAELVYHIETAAGVTVAVLPPDDRASEPGLPAVYRLGRTYRAAGRSNDPTGPLSFFCATRPATIASVGTLLPDSWDDAYNDLLILDCAMYLALKDGRQDELARLTAEREQWLALYTQFLTHETTAIRRRFGQPGQPTIARAGVS